MIMIMIIIILFIIHNNNHSHKRFLHQHIDSLGCGGHSLEETSK
jgi:hypothetical protein